MSAMETGVVPSCSRETVMMVRYAFCPRFGSLTWIGNWVARMSRPPVPSIPWTIASISRVTDWVVNAQTYAMSESSTPGGRCASSGRNSLVWPG